MIKFDDLPEGAKPSVRLVAKELVIPLDEAANRCAIIGAEVTALMIDPSSDQYDIMRMLQVAIDTAKLEMG